MRLYRLAKTPFARDLTGEGARLKGGRWSPPGIAVIHTSESVALAAMELLVHIGSPRFFPGDLSLVEYDLAEGGTLLDIPMEDLPANWRQVPEPTELKTIGHQWAAEGIFLALRLPSAPVPYGKERNVLINPRHAEFAAKFRLVQIQPFDYDQRIKDVARRG